jgi:hypothetical protein
MTGLDGGTVTRALRAGVDLQLIAAGHSEFRFRHALTHEAVLAVLPPWSPEPKRLWPYASHPTTRTWLPRARCWLMWEGRPDTPR